MHKDDVQAMSEGADSLRVMIVLFSTASAGEAVLIGTSDTVHVRLIKNGDSVRDEGCGHGAWSPWTLWKWGIGPDGNHEL